MSGYITIENVNNDFISFSAEYEKVEKIVIRNCLNLKTVILNSEFPNLKSINISCNVFLETFVIIKNISSLRNIKIKNTLISSLYLSYKFENLITLTLVNNTLLKNIIINPEIVNIRYIHIENCPIEDFHFNLNLLYILYLKDCSNLKLIKSDSFLLFLKYFVKINLPKLQKVDINTKGDINRDNKVNIKDIYNYIISHV